MATAGLVIVANHKIMLSDIYLFLIGAEIIMLFFSVLVAHLTVISYKSRQFPTVLQPGHVHRNKLISLFNREEQQELRKRH